MFKLKNDDEKLFKYKARLMVKGFHQKQGIDFDEIFSPVVKMCSIRVILGLMLRLFCVLKLFPSIGTDVVKHYNTVGVHGSFPQRVVS